MTAQTVSTAAQRPTESNKLGRGAAPIDRRPSVTDTMAFADHILDAWGVILSVQDYDRLIERLRNCFRGLR